VTDTTTTHRIALTRRLPRRARLAVLADALAVADAAEAELIGPELLELAVSSPAFELPDAIRQLVPGAIRNMERRRRLSSRSLADAALTELARRWTRLDVQTRRVAASLDRARWTAAVSPILNDDAPELRASLPAVARDVGAPELTPALVRLLPDADDAIGDAAATALNLIVRDAYDQLEINRRDATTGTPSDAFSPVLLSAIIDAADTYANHKRREALFGALLLLEGPGKSVAPPLFAEALNQLISDPTLPASKGIRGLMRWSSEPLVRARAWAWLVDDAIAGPAIDRFARAQSPADHDAVLTRSHLALRARRRSRLTMIEIKPLPDRSPNSAPTIPPNAPLPDAHTYKLLSPAARRGLPRLVDSMVLDPMIREAALAPTLADPEASVRHAAARSAVAASTADFTFDADPRVARTAALAWSSVGTLQGSRSPRTAIAEKLARSPHAAVRAVARHELRRSNPWRPDDPISRLDARRRLRRDRAGFIKRLRAHTSADEPRAAIAAIIITRRLGLAPYIEDTLLELASTSRPTTPNVLATAVGALGDLDTDLSLAAIFLRVGDGDDRVRSNAIEALVRRSRTMPDLAVGAPDLYDAMIEHTDDAHHRVRANAVLGLTRPRPGHNGAQPGARIEPKPTARLHEPVATQALRDMLDDDRPMHRLAGLWLAGRVLLGARPTRLADNWVELSERVTSLLDDTDERVSMRARRCHDRLTHARVGLEQGTRP